MARKTAYPDAGTENKDIENALGFKLLKSLICEPSISKTPVVHHRCRGGCSFGKKNLFIFPCVYLHRPSQVSILFPSVFAALRLRAMQNLFGSSTEPCGFRGYNPLPQNIKIYRDVDVAPTDSSNEVKPLRRSSTSSRI
jgi:hypothetical protein